METKPGSDSALPGVLEGLQAEHCRAHDAVRAGIDSGASPDRLVQLAAREELFARLTGLIGWLFEHHPAVLEEMATSGHASNPYAIGQDVLARARVVARFTVMVPAQLPLSVLIDWGDTLGLVHREAGRALAFGSLKTGKGRMVYLGESYWPSEAA